MHNSIRYTCWCGSQIILAWTFFAPKSKSASAWMQDARMRRAPLTCSVNIIIIKCDTGCHIVSPLSSTVELKEKNCCAPYEGKSLLEPTRFPWYQKPLSDIIGDKVILLGIKSYSASMFWALRYSMATLQKALSLSSKISGSTGLKLRKKRKITLGHD